MNRLEDQVAPRKQALRLKELGVKQEGTFYWVEDHVGLKLCYHRRNGMYVWFSNPAVAWYSDKAIAAFTTEESFEALPGDIEINGLRHILIIGKPMDEPQVRYQHTVPGSLQCNSVITKKADTLAEALAEMRVYLIENGILKP